MRTTIHKQQRLVPIAIVHEHAAELRQVSELLDDMPEIAEWVYEDLVRGVGDPTQGREAMTAEQVLRVLVIKQMNSFSYEELAFHLADSFSYRAFCRLGFGAAVPRKSTLNRNIKRVRPETLERINRRQLKYARQQGIERARKIRIDCTVEETNIHEPSDSSLLWDCVRVLVRLMHVATERVAITFTDHSRRAKRRSIGILNAKSTAKRRSLYQDLLKVTERTVRYADQTVQALDTYRSTSVVDMALTGQLKDDMQHYISLAKRVVDQTQRRVLNGESVPAKDKVMSIFETHTDIIVKDRRETYYGHKLCLTTGASGLVLDCVILNGNPNDSTLAVDMVERQMDIYGRPPRQASFDGGFASRYNLGAIKKLQVEDVVFSKGRGILVSEMAKSTWVYRSLRRFRAGIEAGISFLKRCFGLDRCTWRGLESFKAYTWASIVSANLLLLARHQLG